MAIKKSCHSKKNHHPNELTLSKEKIKKLEKEISALKQSYTKELASLMEEAYVAGYSDAIADFDKKAEAMEKFLHKALKEFEQDYKKNMMITSIPSKKRKK